MQTARQMVDVFAPPLSLLCKLGSIVVHVEEGADEGGHAYDWMAVRCLLADREVQDWIEGMRNKALVPVKRSERNEDRRTTRPPGKGAKRVR